ncbi:MAG: molybdopterin-dependent oxidoreductase [Planctomycetota bacterium]
MPTTHRTVCPLDCPDRCSMDVTVEGDRILKIDGSDLLPLTAGYICSKVRHFDRRVDSPDRILHPMLRKGKKGGGEFVRITWDEAIATIAAKFRELIQQYGAQSILPYSYSGSNGLLTSHAMDERFWNRLGSSQLLRTLCAANTGAAWLSVFDDLPGSDPMEMQHSDALVLWGVNPSSSGIHTVPLVQHATKNGAYLCVVDPRKTPLAKKANDHLAVLPGTDVALALGMIHVAIVEKLIDVNFIQQFSRGFDILQKTAMEWTPARASALTGVPAELIANVPRVIARAKAPFFRVGWGHERNRNGVDSIRAVLLLRAIFGKFNEAGGGLTLSTTKGYRMDLTKAEGVGLRRGKSRIINMSEIGRALEDVNDPPIQGLFVYNCNPLATAPNQTRIERAMRRESLFTVVHDQVLTDTCALADIVLPATTFLEHHELCRSYGGYALQWGVPVIPARGESKPNHQVFQLLAKAMGFDDPELNVTETEIAREVYATASSVGVDFDTFTKTNIAPLKPRKLFVDIFPTRGFMDFAGPAPLAYRENPSDATLPFSLISPSTEKAISSTLYEQSAPGSSTLHISPEDAAARGFIDGQIVKIHNSFAEVVVRLEVSSEVPRGVLSLPKGIWRRSTLNGNTSNALAPDHVDAEGRGACFNDARVEIAPA